MSPRPQTGIFAATLATATLAMAGGYMQRPTSEAWTEPAGVTGDSATVALTSAPYYGLRALKLEQFDGKPCVLETGQASLNTGGLNWLDQRIKACEPTVGQEWKQADVGENQFITEIAVCTAPEGEAIQGLEIWGAKLTETGAAVAPSTHVKLEFTECKKWQPKRACPAGSIATGIRAHYSKGKSGLVGLSLRCHRIQSQDKGSKGEKSSID